MTKRLRLGLIAVVALAGVALSACGPSSAADDAINRSFGPAAGQARAVAQCESSLNPNAISPGGGNYGLFQINRVNAGLVSSLGYSWNQILDPYVNAAVAKAMFDRQGWAPWACRRVLG
jgi:soluble lytic murein transglycosylase-like protein